MTRSSGRDPPSHSGVSTVAPVTARDGSRRKWRHRSWQSLRSRIGPLDGRSKSMQMKSGRHSTSYDEGRRGGWHGPVGLRASEKGRMSQSTYRPQRAAARPSNAGKSLNAQDPINPNIAEAILEGRTCPKSPAGPSFFSRGARTDGLAFSKRSHKLSRKVGKRFGLASVLRVWQFPGSAITSPPISSNKDCCSQNDGAYHFD
jgi:hypothetical protein